MESRYVLYRTQGSQRVISVQIHGIRPIGLGDPGKHLGDTPFFGHLIVPLSFIMATIPEKSQASAARNGT